MNIKRMIFLAAMVVAVAALAMPLIGLRSVAATSAVTSKPSVPTVAPSPATTAAPAPRQAEQGVRLANGQVALPVDGGAPTDQGSISPDVRNALGLVKAKDPRAASEKIARRIKSGRAGDVSIQSGEPEVLAGNAAFSAALLTTIGGRDNQFSEVAMLADWDGREDCAADRSKKVDDFSGVEPDIDFSLTRTAFSEHTIANGFAENIFYHGDSVGNVWVGADTTGDGRVDSVTQLNLPTLLNAFGTINSDDQVTITGLGVNPVADLTSFSNVNGAFAPFAGQIGEILYVTFFDSESGLRLTPNNTPVRSGLLAFPIADLVSAAQAPPGIQSQAGFPVTVGGAFGVAFSVFANVAGLAVDDDGSVYFQNVDLIQFTGANIVKITSQDSANFQDRSLATNGFPTITDLNPANGSYGTASGPATQVNRFTNYSGTSTLFGNIVALASGGCNVLYAAVSRSFVAGAVSFEQLTEGLFPAPSAFAAGTPSMVISFADCSGAFDLCSGIQGAAGGPTNIAGIIPAADGFADVAQAGLTRTPGVNNFRIFVEGNGPNLAPPAGGTAVVPGTPSNLLQVDMQIDYTVHSGLAVNEENTVFVVSGGTPAGIGKNPSPMLGEILCFEDRCPADRRADFVDLRGDNLPTPPSSGDPTKNVGDGDSDRFDHIFWQSPLDQVTLTPAGIAGLSRGFLRYTNRLALGQGLGFPPGQVSLGRTLRVLGDDDSAGLPGLPAPIFFDNLDPSHQVAGGDDQNPPFKGDDDDGAGNAVNPGGPITAVGPLSGGFEFVFGGPVGTANCVWNGFFWNSNGNITFGGGDTSNIANVPAFRSGLPKIAPAWADLNPGARDAGFLRDFPVMALGFANINAFKIRWINVPEFGSEACTGSALLSSIPGQQGSVIEFGTSNTFSITLFDDGTGIDENASQPLNPANPIGNNAVPFDLQEGPTDLRFTKEPNTGTIVGCRPRPEGSGIFIFDFCRMDLLGTDTNPVITGFSIGGLNPLNPPGLCEINLSKAAAAADAGTFGVLPDTNQQTAQICANCCIGEGTEPTLFELFNEGTRAGIGSGGEVTFGRPDFDLRFEGNDAALCSSVRQRDLNKGRVCFFGVGCTFPANPTCNTVVPGTFVTTPTTTGLVNALCAVQLNLVGCGFFPNETTTICQGFTSETGIPLQRGGKTVTTAATLACDTNGDLTPEATIVLTPVLPLNCNLVRATIPVSASFGPSSTTGFPGTCCGGPATVTITTSFTAADNNVFGAFTRTSVCSLNLGLRAPVVISVTPSSGNCAVGQDLLITGACFTFTTPNPLAGQPGQPATISGTATSVFAQDAANPATRIQAQTFVVVNANLIDAFFNFGSANAGKTFLIFVTGPGGTSRGLITPVAGQPAGCALGNEQGCLPCISFTCNAAGGGTPGTGGTPEIATVTSCKLDRQDTGQFFLDVTGTGIKDGATATVGGVTPKKIKVVEVQPGTTNPTKLRLIKKVCNGLPGAVIITNPGPNGGPSQPFNCTERCPAQ